MPASQIRILIVEDDAVDRMACRRALAQAPETFLLLEAETGRAGLQFALSERPDCVLLDHHLPDMDGLEFLQELAQEGGAVPIPVLMLTGADNAAIAVEAMRRGARDYLVKDIERRYLELLPAVIQRVLREQTALAERKQALEQLRQAEAKYRTLVEQIPAITYMASLDRPGALLYVSPQVKRLGFSPDEWLDDPQFRLERVHPDDRTRVAELLANRQSRGNSLCSEYRLLARDGGIFWFRDQASVVSDEAGRPLFLQGILVDVSDDKRVEAELKAHRFRLEELVARRTAALTRANGQLRQDILERQRMEQELFREKERAQVTLQAIADGVITTDAAGRIEYLNPVAEQLAGWPRAKAQGRPLREVLPLIQEDTGEPAEDPAIRCLRGDPDKEGCRQNLLVRRDGVEFVVANSTSPIHDRDGTVSGAVVVLHDVTQQYRLTQQLSYQATHDALTGLVNRHEFERRLERVLASARNDGTEHALCFLDLDRFKAVNDTGGHAAGDELLRQISILLQDKVRQRDTLARLGGDEFCALLERCSLDQARRIADSLLKAVQAFRFSWNGRHFTLGASIGLVAVSGGSGSLSEVLNAADAACYAAKQCGRNRVHVNQDGDASVVRRRNDGQWISRLTQAIERDALRLYCQPFAALAAEASERTYHEILLRLLDPEGKPVAPAEFLPVAERYNLMPGVDRWVVHRTIAWLGGRMREETGPTYFVNLAAATLADPAMPDHIAELLREHGVAADAIGFEISESTAMANLPQAARFLRAVKELGCWTALDNFGEAFSAIPNLKSLPVDFIKISGSFVREILADAVAHALVDAVNQVAHVMVIRTVAECAESEAIVERLRALGVDHAQGYALSSPRPLEEGLPEEK